MKSLISILTVSFFFPALVVAGPISLTPQQMAAAVELEDITMPTPGEIFAAIAKKSKANWASIGKKDFVSETSARPQIALNLGTLIADGYIAIEAQDSQGVKNIGKDLLNLAKKLNVSQTLLARGSSLTDFAENYQWSTLREELEATQNEVKLTMTEQKDEDLMILVTLGAWIRGMQAVTGIVNNDYSPAAAELLRQTAIVDYLLKKIGQLPPKIQSTEILTNLTHELSKIYTIVHNSSESLSPESIRELNQIATLMMNDILGKNQPSPPA